MLANTLIFCRRRHPYLHSDPGDVLWESPTGRKAFGLSASFARETRVMAANQGLYNGFGRGFAVGTLESRERI